MRNFCVWRSEIALLFQCVRHKNVLLLSPYSYSKITLYFCPEDGTVQEYLDGMFSEVLSEGKDSPNSQPRLHDLGRRIVFAPLPGLSIILHIRSSSTAIDNSFFASSNPSAGSDNALSCGMGIGDCVTGCFFAVKRWVCCFACVVAIRTFLITRFYAVLMSSLPRRRCARWM